MLLAPILFFKGFTLLFSLGLWGVLQAVYNLQQNWGRDGTLSNFISYIFSPWYSEFMED
jgi:hypothetical protein